MGWGHHGRRRERLFEKGELKYLFLDVLREKPRHGYDLMRAVEEIAQGRYTASPGAVYPILQMLEDQGHVVAATADGRKTYSVTEPGLAFLAAHADTVADVRRRLGTDGGGRGPDMGWVDLAHELGAFAQLLGHGRHLRHLDADAVRRVQAILAGARREIEEILEAR